MIGGRHGIVPRVVPGPVVWVPETKRYSETASAPIQGDSLLFVYGTLMAGYHNHGLLNPQGVFVEERVVSGYSIYGPHESFPKMIRDPEGVVHGEVYRVPPTVLLATDQLEGYRAGEPRSLYLRAEVEPGLQAYVWNGEAGGRVKIIGGNWKAIRPPTIYNRA